LKSVYFKEVMKMMNKGIELLYMYFNGDLLEQLKDLQLNFGGPFKGNYDKKTNTLFIKQNKDFIEGFWGKNISNITSLVGKNGAGKTTVLRELSINFFENFNNIKIMIIRDNSDIKIYFNMSKLKGSSSYEEYNKELNTLKIIFQNGDEEKNIKKYDNVDITNHTNAGVKIYNIDETIQDCCKIEYNLIGIFSNTLILESRRKDYKYDFNQKNTSIYFSNIMNQSCLGIREPQGKGKIIDISTNKKLNFAQVSSRNRESNVLSSYFIEEFKSVTKLLKFQMEKEKEFIRVPREIEIFFELDTNQLMKFLINKLNYFKDDELLNNKILEQYLKRSTKVSLEKKNQFIYKLEEKFKQNETTREVVKILLYKMAVEESKETQSNKVLHDKLKKSQFLWEFKNTFYSIVSLYLSFNKEIITQENRAEFLELTKRIINSEHSMSFQYEIVWYLKLIHQIIPNKYSELIIFIYYLIVESIVDDSRNSCTFYKEDITYVMIVIWEKILDFIQKDDCLCNVFGFRWNYRNYSSGQESRIILFSRLLEALESIDDSYNSATICLDEPENTFHPEWKRKLVDDIIGFLDMYNEKSGKDIKYQIFIATSDPLILSDVPKNNTVYLKTVGLEKAVPNIVSIDNKGCEETFSNNIHNLYKHTMQLGDIYRGEFSHKKIKWISKEIYNIKRELYGNHFNEVSERIPDCERRLKNLKKNAQLIGEKIIRIPILNMIIATEQEIMYMKNMK